MECALHAKPNPLGGLYIWGGGYFFAGRQKSSPSVPSPLFKPQTPPPLIYSFRPKKPPGCPSYRPTCRLSRRASGSGLSVRVNSIGFHLTSSPRCPSPNFPRLPFFHSPAGGLVRWPPGGGTAANGAQKYGLPKVSVLPSALFAAWFSASHFPQTRSVPGIF